MRIDIPLDLNKDSGADGNRDSVDMRIGIPLRSESILELVPETRFSNRNLNSHGNGMALRFG